MVMAVMVRETAHRARLVADDREESESAEPGSQPSRSAVDG
jgi:hypothetical protein